MTVVGGTEPEPQPQQHSHAASDGSWPGGEFTVPADTGTGTPAPTVSAGTFVAPDAIVRLTRLIDDARVPLGRVYAEIDAIEARRREHGDSARVIHQARHIAARHIGDAELAEAEFELWQREPRDLSSGCAACELALVADWHAERGEDTQAFESWDALLDGSLLCDLEPHGALARSLVPLIRLGRGERARANHLRGYRISRLKPEMAVSVGEHIEFCALTGNGARGLELLAQHGRWLAEPGAPTLRRAGFLGGAEALLRVLCASGHEDVPFAIAGGGVRALGSLREQIGGQLNEIAASFDARNGTGAVEQRLSRRRSRQPFLSSLPLPAHTLLPPQRRPSPARPAARAKPKPLPELIAEARRLTLLWHPDATATWRQVRNAAATSVAAGGPPLAEDVQVELDEQLLLADASPSVHGDAEAASVQHARLREIADRYRALGSQGEALRAASRAAFALFYGGRTRQAAEEQATLRAAAANALEAGEITPREYMAVRLGAGYQRFHGWLAANDAKVEEYEDAAGAEPGTQEPVSGWFGGGRSAAAPKKPVSHEELHARKARAVAEAAHLALVELDGLVEECRRFDVHLHGAVAAGMAGEVRLGSGEQEAATASLKASVELYAEGGAPWCGALAELHLSRLARARGDLPESERYARGAVEHNLDEQLRGPAAMMLTEAIWSQDGREAEAVAPALAAAAAFGRQDNRPDEARAQVRAAESLAMTGRDDEAVALFEPALHALDALWGDEEWMPLIAQASRAYGNSLVAVGDPRRAAEVLLATAERVKDWPNQMPHAMIAADAATALERADRKLDAAAAFERAAQIWQRAGEPIVHVKCLRSAAWLRMADDLDAALRLMDRAGGDLVTALAAAGGAGDGAPSDQDAARAWTARYELAETHMQRARIVADLAEDGRLPRDESRPVRLESALQDATAAISGLRRLIGVRAAGGLVGENVGRVRESGGDVSGTGGRGLDQTLLERLVFAVLIAARIEGGQLGRTAAASGAMRALADELVSWDKSALTVSLLEFADELDAGPADATPADPGVPGGANAAVAAHADARGDSDADSGAHDGAPLAGA